MKLAAVKALAELARTPVPDIVNLAYNQNNLAFGPEYIIPKPVDPRLLVYRSSGGGQSRYRKRCSADHDRQLGSLRD